jgi:hypothetical protein
LGFSMELWNVRVEVYMKEMEKRGRDYGAVLEV